MIDVLIWIRKTGMVLCCLLGSGMLNAQVNHPEGGFVYDDAGVPRIDISMAQADLDMLYADPWSDVEYKAQFRFTREGVQEDVPDVGIRVRGNTSRNKEKKSFRISFNTFAGGAKFHGIEEMNLNAETNDPSMVRSKLSWNLFRFLGIPAVRSNHVLLYINDDFYGVYINTEHIDENFMKTRFGTNDGNLYKCLWPADLEYLGSDPDDYIIEGDRRRVYELKTNAAWDDYADLSGFIGVIHDYSETRFMEEVEKVMNVQQYIKIMAVDVMTANWDGYIGNKNNYYLYRDQVTGRIEYIPYDLDNTWGLDWLQVDWANQSVYQWSREGRPLYDKIMEQEVYRRQFTGYIKQLAGYMTSDAMEQEVNRWSDQISLWVSQDPYYPLDFGYRYSDFQNAMTTGIPDKWWLPYGVLEYATIRAASALGECVQADAPPLISHARVHPSPEMIRVDWTVEDDTDGFSTTLHYRLDEGEWQTATPLAPSVSDPVSGIMTYLDSIPVPEGAELAEVYFTALDNASQESRYPAAPVSQSFPLANGPLRINEFMASNSSSVADEYGEYDDWVEIYNSTSTRVWLGSLFLSDELGSPGKYNFPPEYLYPDDFYLVWLDGQPEQGENHASFKISKVGEKIRLSSQPSEGFAILDSLTFGPQLTDVALGRSTDGGMEWMAFGQPTPGYSNLSTGLDESLAESRELVLYPNPVAGGILHFSRSASGTIYDVTGKPVMQVWLSDRAEVDSLTPGIYLFRTDSGEALRFVVSGGS